MKSPPDDDELASLLLGPTGNMRAPALLRGKTLVIGFEPGAYEQVMKGRDAR